ncbi:hypothetical protein AC249_AIPGENE28762 [Exaiptasia diaphana]|nr:hypothetical protein AC249_AIPGENE28762 [Exaiptasia diaphana]
MQTKYNKVQTKYTTTTQDDVVMLADANAVIGKWLIGKPLEVYPGRDGKARSAKFSTYVAPGLKAKRLDSKQRNEFARDVCAMIKVHTLHPTKEEMQRVTFLIIEKFLFLADTLGSGTQCWALSIQNNFKNMRKTKRPAKIAAGPGGEVKKKRGGKSNKLV